MKPLDTVEEKKAKKQSFHATLKEAQACCKSYYDNNNQLRDCTCGVCKVRHPTVEEKINYKLKTNYDR